MSLPNVVIKNKRLINIGRSRLLENDLKIEPTENGANNLARYSEVAQYQILDQWCWNAVGSSLCEYFLGENVGGRKVQSNNAVQYIQDAKGKCASINVPGHGEIKYWVPYMKQGEPIHYKAGNVACNKPNWPQLITNGTQKLHSEWMWHKKGPEEKDKQRVIAELEKGNPVGMYINWGPGRGAHVVTIYGSYKHDGHDVFNFADPYIGLESARGAPSGGVWAGSLVTRKIVVEEK